MAFLFRDGESHNNTLNKFCERLSIKTKHGCLLWIVENIEILMAERDEFFQKTVCQEKRIKALELAIKNKIEADRHLAEIVDLTR